MSYSHVTFEVSSDSKYVAISGNSVNSQSALVRIYSIFNIMTDLSTEVCRYPIPSNDIGDIAWC